MQYGYDSAGRLVRTQTGNGTIYRTVYNSVGEALTDAADEKVAFRGNRPLKQLLLAVPAILQEFVERKHNVIVRALPALR